MKGENKMKKMIKRLVFAMVIVALFFITGPLKFHSPLSTSFNNAESALLGTHPIRLKAVITDIAPPSRNAPSNDLK